MLLIATLALSACGQNSSESKLPDAINPDKMQENYNADVAWIHVEKVPDVGEGLVYRQIDKLEDFVAQTNTPIVLCQVEYKHESTVLAQPYLERLAEQYPNQVAVVMAKTSSKDTFFNLFLPEGWPAFYLLNGGEKVAQYYGFTEEMKEGVTKFVKEYAKGTA